MMNLSAMTLDLAINSWCICNDGLRKKVRGSSFWRDPCLCLSLDRVVRNLRGEHHTKKQVSRWVVKTENTLLVMHRVNDTLEPVHEHYP